MKKLFLIDGHSLIFRMYFAFLRRPMINSKGMDTSIMFGFTKYLLEIIKKEKPSHIAVAFDPPCKTFRHQAYKEYKANRETTPDLVKSSLEPIIEIVKSLNIPVLMVPGFEADDVIGSMAKQSEKNGFTTYMVSPDKDFGQLISDNIFQFKPGKSGGENEIIGKKEICEKFSIQDPTQVIDILTIWGDASDNVPGIKGIGEVGAKKLISKYGTLENIILHLDELPTKQAQAFQDSADHLDMSKFLVTIKTDIQLDINEDQLKFEISTPAKAKELFKRYEFNSLIPLLPAIEEDERKKQIYTKVNIEEIKKSATTLKRIAILHKEGGDIFLADDKAYFKCNNFSLIKEILEDESIIKIGYNLKEIIKELWREGISFNGELDDIEIMHYVLNPERSHRPDILALSYLGIDINQSSQLEDQPQELELFSNNISEEKEDYDTKIISEIMVYFKLHDAIKKELEQDRSLEELYRKIEMPLIKVLADMEYSGFKIDLLMLHEYSKSLTAHLSNIEESIRESLCEPTLNISSPKQLGILLYEKLQLNPKVKKNTKNNYPTDEESLLKLSDAHPVINQILQYREIKKLISTYIDPLPSLIEKNTGKIHTTFNQALTSTGRLSSVKPNLQNIPIRSELGREIRKAFIPSTPDGYIVSADYSQIELRLMAEISGDEGLLEAFRQGKDVHTSTAAKVYKISESEVTKELRSKAKVANFGIIYGISPYGLTQRLRIPITESKQLIQDYFRSYPKVEKYMKDTKEKAKRDGYVETIYFRKRYVSNSEERNAINAPIQGSAADIIKLAMINVYHRINKEQLKSKLILQVHDELVVDAISSEKDQIMRILREEMENVVHLSIPLTVECNYGNNWLEAH